jgi:hypothetical protein
MKRYTGSISKRLARFAVKLSGGYLARQLYQEILGRNADENELSRSKALIQRSGRINPLVKELLESKEFRDRSFNASVPVMTTQIYQAILGRKVDGNGLSRAKSLMQGSGRIAPLMKELLESKEFRDSCFNASVPAMTTQIYQEILRRNAEGDELSRAETFIQRSGSIAPLMKELLESKEFRDRCFNATVPAMAAQLYQEILGRDAEGNELSRAETQIQGSGRIASLVKELLESKEFRDRSFNASVPEFVIAGYQAIFGRDPDEAHLKHHVIEIQTNRNTADFLGGLIESTEFKQIAASKPLAPPNPARVPKSSDGGRRILVTSHCQTYGIADALQIFLPSDTLIPLSIPDTSNSESVKKFIENLTGIDVWVSILDLSWATSNGFEKKPGFQFVKIPRVAFSAFHPDLCYARDLHTGNYTKNNYESSIGIWAYNHQLEVADAAKLFNRDTYAKLGYFDLWNPSISNLRISFEDCGLDFSSFMLPIKRSGLFMYSINHPKISVLVELSKQVAIKLGASPSMIERDFYIEDRLMASGIWPLYPEIADELSLSEGSYNWRVNSPWLRGVEQYLQFAYDDYKRQNIPHHGIRMENRDETLYNLVLGDQVTATK